MKSIVSKAEAELELALMQAESDSMTSSDLYIWLRECGLPPEIAIRIKDLVNVTKRIGDKVVSIGKLIVMKLRDFITAHKGLVIGSLLGAAIASLVSALPLLGSLLAPLGTLLGLTFVVTGYQQDKYEAGGAVRLLEVPQNLIEIAQVYFEVFIETLQAVMTELTSVKTS
ncbi:hypothetical protein ACVWY1_005088 [Pseudomonas sp. TE6288]|uniref:hypothetical protein n=1 Tax=Pseudomonas TaxID=286 RepID=UPI0020B77DEB|nr:hypothetical protein [Pseudomonas sp. N2-11]MCP3792535.1 hypothetical protein [Pseudomonas sp. N2-11]